MMTINTDFLTRCIRHDSEGQSNLLKPMCGFKYFDYVDVGSMNALPKMLDSCGPILAPSFDCPKPPNI